MNNEQSKPTPTEPRQDSRPQDPKRRDGAHARDPLREDPMNGAHQGSTGQRDKHDR